MKMLFKQRFFSWFDSYDIFDESGEVVKGVISAEINSAFVAFDLKITGFTTEAQKNVQLALGAYVKVTEDGVASYSYMQAKAPADGEVYHFTSFSLAVSEPA